MEMSPLLAEKCGAGLGSEGQLPTPLAEWAVLELLQARLGVLSAFPSVASSGWEVCSTASLAGYVPPAFPQECCAGLDTTFARTIPFHIHVTNTSHRRYRDDRKQMWSQLKYTGFFPRRFIA